MSYWWELENLVAEAKKIYPNKEFTIKVRKQQVWKSNEERINGNDEESVIEETKDASLELRYGKIHINIGEYHPGCGTPPYLEGTERGFISCGLDYNIPSKNGTGRKIGGCSGGNVNSIEDFKAVLKEHLTKLRESFNECEQIALF